MSNLKSRVRGLAATVAIVAFVAGTPVTLVIVGAIPSPSSFGWDALTRPDDGTLALAVIGVVAWLAWLMFTVSMGLEAGALMRGVRAPTIPGLRVPQIAAGRLIATAALLFAALPIATPAFPAPHSEASVIHEFPSVLVHEQTAMAPATTQAAPISHTFEGTTPAADRHHTPTVRYTVRRGDSLWKIAQERLGHGTRYVEIVALNSEALNGHPDFITPGLVLVLPDEHTDAPNSSESYVVVQGDTLSEIAQENLGAASLYPKIVEASRHTLQPDGDHLRDPNLIRPGWRLTIPDTKAPNPTEPANHNPQPPKSADPPPDPPKPAETDPPIGTIQEPPGHGREPTVTGAHGAHTGAAVPGWVLPGLTGAGTLLAGSLLLALRRHLRTQLRFRRPGHVIALTPAELLPVEKTAHLSGGTTAPQIEHLDALLRSLVAAGGTMPQLTAAELAHDRVVVHLAQNAKLSSPWTGSGTTWSATLDADVPTAMCQVAPYPLLVTVGQDDDGHLWLLNLEELGSIAVVGDGDGAEAFGRYVAAELALNPWSALVHVETLGFAAELTSTDPLRFHHHAVGDTGFLDRLALDLEHDSDSQALEPEQFRAVVTTGEHNDTESVRRIVKIITNDPDRSGAAVVAINADPAPGDVILMLTTGGRLRSQDLGLDVLAAGLTSDEAAACAAIVAVTRDAENTRMPVDDRSNNGLATLTDAAGAVRVEFTKPRPRGPAGKESLLPFATEEYELVSATTVDDVEVLAPVTPIEARSKITEADARLDADLAFWFELDSPFPRLTLLGPVTARAHADAKAVVKRKPYYVEMLAFLALHPSGATSTEIADAFSITTNRARVDLNALRAWLGVNPRTGTEHLPNANRSRAASERGVPAYQVEDVLIDVDLFRRLRARGQARGADGMVDLETALRLVTGEPFSHLRPAGWTWLLDGDRLDHIMTCAIVDVAHIVTTHALAAKNLSLARTAAEIAYGAAPDDEISRLDLVQVAFIAGHADLAERQLIDGVFNRSDDDLGPIDLSERTVKIAGQQGWAGFKHPSNR